MIKWPVDPLADCSKQDAVNARFILENGDLFELVGAVSSIVVSYLNPGHPEAQNLPKLHSFYLKNRMI